MHPAKSEEAPAHTHAKIKEPQSPELNISSKREPKSYKLACKYALRKFGHIELRSLGNAAESVVALADSLVRNKFAVFQKIESGIAEMETDEKDARTRKSIKFIVHLAKSKEFDELAKDLPPLEN